MQGRNTLREYNRPFGTAGIDSDFFETLDKRAELRGTAGERGGVEVLQMEQRLAFSFAVVGQIRFGLDARQPGGDRLGQRLRRRKEGLSQRPREEAVPARRFTRFGPKPSLLELGCDCVFFT